ncbi:uncharacterized protein J3D65DRAFT_66850 [Phyllosticta citribraziliensis]|uniref:Uncharacterized protein n=1 Tax=Phyllosticta citribraziliensis TaxID=989973 RepID=A0ABR1LCQ0_9PEZI
MTSKRGSNNGESKELMDGVSIGETRDLRKTARVMTVAQYEEARVQAEEPERLKSYTLPPPLPPPFHTMKVSMRCGVKDHLEPGQLEGIRQAAMLGEERGREGRQQAFGDQLEAQLKEQESFPPPDAAPSPQYFTDFLAWLENPSTKATMGAEPWESAKISAQGGDWEGLENLQCFLHRCDYEKSDQWPSYRYWQMLHSAPRVICERVKRNCSRRNRGVTQPSIEREARAEVVGSQSSSSLSLPLTTEPQSVDSTVPQGPTCFCGWHSNPGPQGELPVPHDPPVTLPSRLLATSFSPPSPFRVPGRGDNNANDGGPKGKEKQEQN